MPEAPIEDKEMNDSGKVFEKYFQWQTLFSKLTHKMTLNFKLPKKLNQ